MTEAIEHITVGLFHLDTEASFFDQTPYTLSFRRESRRRIPYGRPENRYCEQSKTAVEKQKNLNPIEKKSIRISTSFEEE